MSDLTGGHLVARTLKEAGVKHVFTLCGGHILPIYDGCVNEGLGVVDMRHEQACAHAGDAYARLTRNIGVAVVTAGPGVTDAVTGVANAFSARSPLLLIGGAAPLGLRGLGALQETEQVALLRPITKGSWTVAETRQIPEVLTTAIRTALTGRPGPVFVEIPVDLLMTMIEDRLAPIPTRYVHRGAALADPDDVVRIGHLISRAERPVVLAGSGVYWDDAAGSLASFADSSGVPVFMNGAGRGSLPPEHPCAFAQARGWAQRRSRSRAGRAPRLPSGIRTAADLRGRRARGHGRLRPGGAGTQSAPGTRPARSHRPCSRSARRDPPRRARGAFRGVAAPGRPEGAGRPRPARG